MLIEFAFTIASSINDVKPKSYKEALSINVSKQWQ